MKKEKRLQSHKVHNYKAKIILVLKMKIKALEPKFYLKKIKSFIYQSSFAINKSSKESHNANSSNHFHQKHLTRKELRMRNKRDEKKINLSHFLESSSLLEHTGVTMSLKQISSN